MALEDRIESFMKLDFAKLHGAGNDFVFIDDRSEEIALTDEQVRFLCDRHFGIGADGVIFVRPSKRDDCVAYMHYINDDGSLAEMCGNGIRCFAKYLVDRGIVATDQRCFAVDTLAGKRLIHFETDGSGALSCATVDMGEPVFEPWLIPTTLEANGAVTRRAADGVTVEEPAVIEATIETAGETTIETAGGVLPETHAVSHAVGEIPSSCFDDVRLISDGLRFTCVNMGNPHAIAFFEGDDKLIRELDWHGLGRALEHHPVFPARANIEFARVLWSGQIESPESLESQKSQKSPESAGPLESQKLPEPPESAEPLESQKSPGNAEALIEMRVWERGVGETLACGTGACATAVAAAVTGRAARRATVRLLGGDLRIEWLENNHVMMTGPAVTVYEGTIEL
jgi:diaminopimelate epimerase